MNVPDDIRPRGIEDLVTAFQPLEIGLERQFPVLQHGAHRPIGDDDPMVHCIQKRLGTNGTRDRVDIERKTRHVNRLRPGPVTVRHVSMCYDGGWSPCYPLPRPIDYQLNGPSRGARRPSSDALLQLCGTTTCTALRSMVKSVGVAVAISPSRFTDSRGSVTSRTRRLVRWCTRSCSTKLPSLRDRAIFTCSRSPAIAMA